MKSVFISVMLIILMAITLNAQGQPNSGKTKMSAEAYKAKTVELFKELMALKKEGVFPSQFGLGPGNPKAHNWYLKWSELNKTECQGLPFLFLPDGDGVFVGDLYQLAKALYRGREKTAGKNRFEKPLLTRFQLAVTCYETPDSKVCKEE